MTVVHVDRCRICGCTPQTPCMLTDEHGTYECSWMDLDHTLCSSPRCVGALPLKALLQMQIFPLKRN
jgi:hypothetical protein